MNNFIKVSEFSKLAKMTHQRVYQLCKGYKQTKNGKTYTFKAQWHKGKDWRYVEGDMMINKLKLKRVT